MPFYHNTRYENVKARTVYLELEPSITIFILLA